MLFRVHFMGTFLHCGLPRWCSGKQSACHSRRLQRHGFDPWLWKIPWSRKWQPTPVFLPGESPWTEEPGWLQSMGSQTVGQNWTTKHSIVWVKFLKNGVYKTISYHFKTAWILRQKMVKSLFIILMRHCSFKYKESRGKYTINHFEVQVDLNRWGKNYV